MNKRQYKNYIVFLLFLGIAVIAYYQIAFFLNSLRWDAVDVYLPWKFYASECFNSGFYPFWNPYQQLGYPYHADLQFPIWYPISTLYAILVGYSIYTIQIEFIIYITVAGFGFYLLSSHFYKNQYTSIILGVCYMLSGFFVSHIQSFTLIIGASLLPYTIYFYLELLKNRTFVSSSIFVVFMYLLISGGYQAITIILFYLFLTLFFFEAIRLYRNKEHLKLRKAVFLHIYGAFAIFALSSIMLVLLSQLSEYSNRFGGLTLEKVQYGPFTPKSMISFLWPYSTVDNESFFGTNNSMRNAYFGILTLFFAFLSLNKIRNVQLKIIFLFGVFSLLAAFGEYFPVRRMLYYFFPLMDMFRFPSVFRIFFIIGALLVSGIIIDNFHNERRRVQKTFPFFVSIYFLVTLVFVIWFILKQNLTLNASLLKLIPGRIIIQSSVHVILLIISFLLLRRETHKPLFVLVIIDLIIAVQLNIYSTGVSKHNPHQIAFELNQFPKGISIPNINNRIINNSDISNAITPLWRNTNIFSKQFSYDGYTSFKLKGYNYLFDSIPTIKDSILSNKIAYCSNNLITTNEINPSSFQKGTIALDDTDFKQLKPKVKFTELCANIELTKLTPSSFEFNVKVDNNAVFNLNQSKYHGWQVLVNGEEKKLLQTNMATMGVYIPKGSHTLQFKYKNLSYTIVLLASYIFFILLISIVLTKQKKHIGLAIFLSISIFAFVKFHFANNIRDVQYDNLLDAFSESINEKTSIFFADRMQHSTVNNYFINYNDYSSTTGLYKNLNDNVGSIQILNFGMYIPEEIEEFINHNYTLNYKKELGKNFYYKVLNKKAVLKELKNEQLNAISDGILYSPSIKRKIDKRISKIKLISSVEVSNSIVNGSYLVVEQKRNNQLLNWYARPLVCYNDSLSLNLLVKTIFDVKKDDEFKTYVWNPDKNSFLIKNQRFELKLDE